MNEANPYKSPRAGECAEGRSASTLLWLGAGCSLVCSLSSLVLFYLYGYWHSYEGPWKESLPGKLGYSWLFAVDGSKAVSMILAILSLAITIAIFRAKGYWQGMISLPTCVLSLMTVGYVT